MPGTAANGNKKSEVELVTARVSKTKKEIEQLKEQLQKLINDGITKSDFTETKQNVAALSNEYKTVGDSNDEIVKSSTDISLNRAKAFKDNVAELLAPNQLITVPKRKSKSPQKQQQQAESPKKIRNYDQDAAREYIKKQKEKRRELMKNKKKEVDSSQDMKKQRLQELRQKSLQLVSKNVQHRRERSRSRSRDALDCSSEIIMEAKKLSQSQPQPETSRFMKAGNDAVSKKAKTEFSQTKHVKFAHPQVKNITIRSSLRDLSAIPKLNISKHIQFDVAPNKSSACNTNSSVEPKQQQQAATISNFVPNNEEEDQIKKIEAAVKIQACFRGYRQRKLYQFALKLQQKFKRRERLTKEVQTVEIKPNTPIWLQPPTSLPYPYNFISTVKRKLNLAVQQITTTNDAAVQSSFQEKSTSVRNEKIKNSNHKTDLKSFLSQKCLDLDMKAIEPLVLTRTSLRQDKNETFLKSEAKNGFIASDSDTSKNIPDISSESCLTANKRPTSKRSHSSDTDHSDIKIDLKRIKKIKLLNPKRLNFNNEMNGEISEHLEGSPSFKSPKSTPDNVLVTPDDFSGRDSIIASNKCDYTGLKEPKVALKQPELNLKSKLSKNDSKIVHSTIPHDTLNSFRNYMKSVVEENPAGSGSNSSIIKTQVSSEIPKASKNLSKTVENTHDVFSALSTSIPRLKSPTASTTSNIKTDSMQNPAEVSTNLPTEVSESGKSITTQNREEQSPRYSSSFASIHSGDTLSMPSLKHPSVSLRSSQLDLKLKDGRTVTNIVLKPNEKTAFETRVKSNEIHLKFEAELHLLNEFNDSLRQVMAMEKSLLHLHNETNTKNSKPVPTQHTQDTQTSFLNKSSNTDTNISTASLSKDGRKVQNQVPTINYSRGSEVSHQMDIFGTQNTIEETNDASSFVTTGLELSQLKDNMLTSSIEESNVDLLSFTKENLQSNGNVYSGLSIDMFEQLIKDEDVRIENLKTILKIREKALVDRTKGELAWLEIQKKHLRDSGQLQEISAIKKKQRGLLIKLEHERHEMQRLKQMQKAASKERKSVLREQRNMIKAQLSNTNNMITKIKRNTKEERRQSGPLKVYNIKSHSESIRSETSMSRRSSVTEEIISVVSHSQSIISHITEEAVMSGDKKPHKSSDVAPVSTNSVMKTEHVRQSLLMRESALQKRRKAAEELLQWHQRLLEEEGKITELEQAASAIINQVPIVADASEEPTAEKHKFKGSQLNLLWCNMTGRDEKKFNDQMTYSMSKISLERFCKDAKKYALSRNKSFSVKKSERISDSDSNLSAIDVTVTELTQNRGHLRNFKNHYSGGKSSSKSSSKNSQSSGEIETHTIISRSGTKETPDYTSDFETLLSVNKESEIKLVSPDFGQTTVDESLEEQGESSKVPSENLEKSGSVLEATEIQENIIEQSVEIIDEISTPSKYHNKNIDLSVPEIIAIETAPIEQPHEKLTTVEDLAEINDDSTGKDVTTDIDSDEKDTSNIIGLNLENVSSEVEEFASKASHSASSIPIASDHQTVSDFSTNLSDNKDVLSVELKQNHIDKNNRSNAPHEEEFIQSHKEVTETEEEELIKTDENREIELEEIEQVIETEEDKLIATEDEEQSIQTDEESQLVDKSSVKQSNQLSQPSVEQSIPIETKEDLSTYEKDENKSISSGQLIQTNEKLEEEQSGKSIQISTSNSLEENSETNSSRPFEDANQELLDTKEEEEQPVTEENEDQVNLTEEELLVGSKTNTEEEDQLLHKSDDESTKEKSPTSNIHTETNEDQTSTTGVLYQSQHNNITKKEKRRTWIKHDIINPSEIVEGNEFASDKVNEASESSLQLNGNDASSLTILQEQNSISSSGTKPESPLLLSYGFVENKQAEQDANSTNEDTSIEDNIEKLSLEDDDDAGFSEKEVEDLNLTPEKYPLDEEDSLKNHLETNENNQIPENSTELKHDSDKTATEQLTLNFNNTQQKKNSITKEVDHIDVKKRVSEILADANIPSPRGDKSPRLQDLYVTAYDVISPEHSSSSGSPTDEIDEVFKSSRHMYGSDEVEELLKKQLEIEQEIKEIQQQQQKEQVPYLYVREIPNKPPPPYTPPIAIQLPVSGSVLPPTEKHIELITKTAADVLYSAYLNKTLSSVVLSPQDQKSLEDLDNIDNNCSEFVFDLCKEAAIDHYNQFEPETGPSWMHLTKKSKLAKGKPLDRNGLEKFITLKVREWLGYEIVISAENIKHKWSGKKRDHVDDLLVVECQSEEVEWTNYDRDELIVKDQLAKDIMNMLLSETAQVFNDIMNKKSFVY